MENNLSFADIFAALLRRGKRVFLCVLALVLAMGCLSFVRQVRSSRALEGESVSMREYRAYEKEKELLRVQLKNAKTLFAGQQQYVTNSEFLRVDPYNSYVATALLSVKGLPGSVEESYAAARVCEEYLRLWESDDALDTLDRMQLVSIVPDREARYLRELISVTASNHGTITVSSRCNSPADAQLLTDTVLAYFAAQHGEAAEHAYAHELSVAASSVQQSVDEAWAEAQKERSETLTKAKSNAESLEKQLSALQEPAVIGSGHSPAAVIREVVKYMVVGAVLGVFVACLAVWFIHVLRTTVISSYQLERVTALPCLGSLEQSKRLSVRWADRLLKERAWKDAEQAESFILEQFRLHGAEGKQLLLVTDREDVDFAAVQSLLKRLEASGIRASFTAALSKDPAALAQLHGSDKVVLVGRTMHSTVAGLGEILSQCEQAKKDVIGFLFA